MTAHITTGDALFLEGAIAGTVALIGLAAYAAGYIGEMRRQGRTLRGDRRADR